MLALLSGASSISGPWRPTPRTPLHEIGSTVAADMHHFPGHRLRGFSNIHALFLPMCTGRAFTPAERCALSQNRNAPQREQL